MTASLLPSFDIREIPFSRRGSWLNLSTVTGLHVRQDDVHLVSHVGGMHAVLRLAPIREGRPVEVTVTVNPSVLSWDCGPGAAVRATFDRSGALRVKGEGVGMVLADTAELLTSFTGAYLVRDPQDGAYVFTSYETGRRYRVSVLRGETSATGVEHLGAGTRAVEVSGARGWEIAVEELDAAREPFVCGSTFAEAVQAAASDFVDFADAIAPWRNDDVPAATLAAYVLWSATVAPEGFLSRESILMSKHWMDKVWSWDHAFNALAVAPGIPDLALDQFLAPFDHQDATGALPDSIAHSEVLFNFVKPPIHGWALLRLRERMSREMTPAELDEVYRRLSAWSRFWLDRRTRPGGAIPYYQHGNDSGWDNSTAFDRDRVIESPDLAAFLVIQLDVLGDLGEELGCSDARFWREASRRLCAALVDEMSDDAGFFAVGAHSRARSTRTSLLTLLPILAADRLPGQLVEAMAADVERYLTEWGVATQLPGSAEYESDGYWRGPIWAPSTMLVEDGLRRAGFVEMADAVSSRFRRLCERSGFAENFDAITGAGLRDRAYTWTASVYLVLAHDAVLRAAEAPGSTTLPRLRRAD